MSVETDPKGREAKLPIALKHLQTIKISDVLDMANRVYDAVPAGPKVGAKKVSLADVSQGQLFCCKDGRAFTLWGLGTERTMECVFLAIDVLAQYPRTVVPTTPGHTARHIDLPKHVWDAMVAADVNLTDERLPSGTITSWKSALKFLCLRVLHERNTGELVALRKPTRTYKIPVLGSSKPVSPTPEVQTEKVEPKTSTTPAMPGDHRTRTRRLPSDKPNSSNPPRNAPTRTPDNEVTPMEALTGHQNGAGQVDQPSDPKPARRRKARAPTPHPQAQYEVEILSECARLIQRGADSYPYSTRFADMQVLVTYLRTNALKDLQRGGRTDG